MIFSPLTLAKSTGLTREMSERLVKAAGVRIGKTWIALGEDIEEFVRKEKRAYLAKLAADANVQGSSHREDRGKGLGEAPQRSAKEALGLGSKPRRSRRRPSKQSLEVIQGGAEGVDVQEICR